MTACPCAQLMVREHSLRELAEAGFSAEDAKRALDALPVATHNQRGRGAILIGVPHGEALVNHAAYIKSWLAGMKGDRTFIFRAAKLANKTCDYLLSFSAKPEAVGAAQ